MLIVLSHLETVLVIVENTYFCSNFPGFFYLTESLAKRLPRRYDDNMATSDRMKTSNPGNEKLGSENDRNQEKDVIMAAKDDNISLEDKSNVNQDQSIIEETNNDVNDMLTSIEENKAKMNEENQGTIDGTDFAGVSPMDVESEHDYNDTDTLMDTQDQTLNGNEDVVVTTHATLNLIEDNLNKASTNGNDNTSNTNDKGAHATKMRKNAQRKTVNFDKIEIDETTYDMNKYNATRIDKYVVTLKSDGNVREANTNIPKFDPNANNDEIKYQWTFDTDMSIFDSKYQLLNPPQFIELNESMMNNIETLIVEADLEDPKNAYTLYWTIMQAFKINSNKTRDVLKGNDKLCKNITFAIRSVFAHLGRYTDLYFMHMRDLDTPKLRYQNVIRLCKLST